MAVIQSFCPAAAHMRQRSGVKASLRKVGRFTYSKHIFIHLLTSTSVLASIFVDLNLQKCMFLANNKLARETREASSLHTRGKSADRAIIFTHVRSVRNELTHTIALPTLRAWLWHLLLGKVELAAALPQLVGQVITC